MSDSGALLPNREWTALIVPVGGTLDAPRRAIEAVQPQCVAFLASRETAGSIGDIERGLGRTLSWKRVIHTPDHQDLNATYREVSAKLPGILEEWEVEWGDVIVDLTGGTKVMVAALVLATIHRAPRYLYVGGDERDRSGTGMVVPGTERPIETVNPWEEIGTDRLRRVAWAFNRLQFAAAAELARETARLVIRERRVHVSALARMIDGFAAWDRFQHTEARNLLAGSLDDLSQTWSREPGHARLAAELERCIRTLGDRPAASGRAGRPRSAGAP